MSIILLMMRPEDLVGILEGANTAIVADDEYSAATFVCELATQQLAEKTVIVVYSEIKCRKIEKLLSSKAYCSGISSLLSRIPVVKVGKTNRAGFGNVVAYVEERGDLREMCGEIGSILKRLYDSKEIAFFVGFDLVSYLYSPAEIVAGMEELLTHIPEMTKFFLLTRMKRECVPVITNMFDVMIRIKRSRGFDIMAYNRVYDVFVEHSIIRELPPLPLFRIDGEKMVNIV